MASPKTGSTSVEELLHQIDPAGQRFKIDFGGKTYTSEDVASVSLGHATAAEFKDLFGPEEFSRLRKFGFIRDPREKLVSTYFFKRQSRVFDALTKTKSKNRLRVALRSVLGILMARLFPIGLWVRFWPMKKCSDYFLDSDGNLLVDCLGLTDRLSDDLTKMLEYFGVDGIEERVVPHANKSKHLAYQDYFSSPSTLAFIQRKYREDIKLAELVERDIFTNGFESSS